MILCTSSDVANRIKEYSKSKGYLVKDVLTECGLNKNALSIMLSRGSWIRADNLIKIADYLDCSVDYLLGRTTDPESHKQKGPVLMVENEPRYLVCRAGRDGSFSEEYLTKEEIEKIKEEANALEEADF